MKIYQKTKALGGYRPIQSSCIPSRLRSILPLPAGEGRGEGERFERQSASIRRKNGREEGGFVATVQFIALLAIMVMLATANAMALYHLHREVRVLEQQQIKRLNAPETNSVVITHFNVVTAESK